MKDKIKQNRWAQGAFVLLFAAFASFILIHIHAATPTTAIEAESGTLANGTSVITDSAASGGSAVKFGTASGSCVVTALLVNPCRPWIGAYAGDYPASLVNTDTTPATTICPSISSWTDELNCFETRLGRQMDVWHEYNPVGNNSLSAPEQAAAKRSNTILLQNWKPAADWSTATGSNSSVNATIKAMADSVKSIAPTKIMLAIYHEPENDVYPGGSPTCGSSITYKGTIAGNTSANYVAMWHNVRSIFNAEGVNNVVWVMNYIGSTTTWNCMIKDMWPGNSYVDWVTWDPYAGGTMSWTATIGPFYNFLTANSSSTFDVIDKPWGISEFGTYNMTQPNIDNFWQSGIAAEQANTYPKLKMYTYFDDTGALGNHRLYFDDSGNIDPQKQADYNAWANEPAFIGTFTGL